ncbi:hypothetical protein ACS0TY_017293 [Phlomoides rotata]
MAQFFYTIILFLLFLHTIASQKFRVGVDTLFPNQTISFDQTLISQNQLFELGFFRPGKSLNQFLGIWYKSTPDVVVWVANRNNPITNSNGVTLAISRNGSLVISRGGSSIIWSADSPWVISNPVLHLLDTGNLVLVNETEQSYIWQSFDYPTNTRLPGMKMVDNVDAGLQAYLTSWRSREDPSPGDFVLKIDNQGLPEVVILRGKKKITRTGKWNGKYFCGILPFPNLMFKPNLVFSKQRLTSLEDPYDSSILIRDTLNTLGLFQRYRLNSRKDKWNLVFTTPIDTCDEYGLCGPNGICNIDKPIRCECLKGFAPKFLKEWDLQDWSSGCTRNAPLNRRNGDGFVEVRGVKYPDMLKYWLNISMSLGECRAECLKNWSCTAYANPFITNGGSGCVLWFEDLIDIRQVAAPDSKQNLYIRVPVSELVDDDSSIDNTKEKKIPTRLLVISIASGVLVSGLINGSIFMLTKRKRRAAERNNEDLDLPSFKFAAIAAATNNFSSENMIGEGGFGPVYKGNLPSAGQIAIKRLSRTSGQGLEEFKNEVTLIAKLQHQNLVRLLGCCIEGEERMLIYEYLQNKSLDYFVFDRNRRTLLTWPKRFDIIMGIARGLLYLHHDSRLKIIHRDIKTSNILLDEKLNPKISDFGLARTFEEDQPIASTRRVVGTLGYMAPEYTSNGKFSVKSDIFSMGVVLLEIVSGKKNSGFKCSGDNCHSLLEHAWWLWKENKLLDLMEGCLDDTYVETEVKRCIHVALLCVQKFAEDRPMMSSVISMLGTHEVILPDPKEPGFFIGRSSTTEGSCTSPCSMSERNTITITDLEAR